MSPALRIGATGFGLIALCYGFARFAFGLFLPQVDAELDLGPSLGGLISGGSFAGYCIAIVAAAALTERLGARIVALTAAGVAAVGMAGIALADSPQLLAIAVVVAGSSTGLASPPMAAAVAAAVQPERQDATNTIINAGTSAGVALSGAIALAMGGEWRTTFAAFAALAIVLAIVTAFALPPARQSRSAPRLPKMTVPLRRLVAATFLAGMASTAVWSFGGQLASRSPGWDATGTAILWLCIGAGGIAGAWAGSLVSRFGLGSAHLVFCAISAIAVVAIGSATTMLPIMVSGAFFGAAYIVLTGVYLIWGVRALPDRPATGLTIGFLTLAVGQTVGAPIFGLLLERASAPTATIAFAALALAAGFVRPRFDAKGPVADAV